MKLTKLKLKQIIKEEITNIVAEKNSYESPSEIATQVFGRQIGSFKVKREIASDPAYSALRNKEYNIRGQYLVYRSDGELKTLTFPDHHRGRHMRLIHQELEKNGYRENENAGVPTPADYIEELNEISAFHISGEDIAHGLAHDAAAAVVNTQTIENELSTLSREDARMLDEDIRDAVIRIIKTYLKAAK